MTKHFSVKLDNSPYKCFMLQYAANKRDIAFSRGLMSFSYLDITYLHINIYDDGYRELTYSQDNPLCKPVVSLNEAIYRLEAL